MNSVTWNEIRFQSDFIDFYTVAEAEEETITEGKTVNQLFDAIDKSDHVTVERLIKSNPSSVWFYY